MLERGGREVALMDWTAEILAACEPLARQLDQALGEQGHREALAQARERLAQPDSLPSARVLAGLHAQAATPASPAPRARPFATASWPCAGRCGAG